MVRIGCFVVLVGLASAELSLYTTSCGQLTCQFDEYCSPETNRCASCAVVCNNTHHNYDSTLCIKDCQGFLLDLRYLRRTEYEAPVFDASSAQRQARSALIVSGVALAVLLLILIIVCQGKFSWRTIKQRFQPPKNRIKNFPADLTHCNPHAELPKPKPELKLEIRNPEPPKRATAQPLNPKDLETRTSQTDRSQGATTPKTVNTAVSTRHPAEDTTLDFSYDNMGMNVTPSEQDTAAHRF
ncbi:protein grindelwald [Battus philenor]|uniref:protein grindelwald n=1 Tax=Battus philenor TaxID=42288 RepID=UPI0035CEA56B